MFTELSYASIVMSIATLGTEIIFRIKLTEDPTDQLYLLQSNLIVASSATQAIASYFILKFLFNINVIYMRITALIVNALLIASIFLRAKYNFFMPLQDSEYTLYNVTSFFLCIQTFTFGLYWFFNGVEVESQPDVITLSESNQNNRHTSSTPVQRRDEEIDYNLPSYSETPAPPAYSKTIVTDNTTDSNEITETSVPEASSIQHSTQNSDSVTVNMDTESTQHTDLNDTTTNNPDLYEIRSNMPPSYSNIVDTTQH